MQATRPFRFGFLLSATLLLAGCSGSPQVTEPATEPEADAVSGFVPAAYWTECRTLGTYFAAGPAAIFKPEVPPEWQRSDGNPLNEINLFLHRCERVSWGEFERGPIFMALEIHGSFNAPEGCTQDTEAVDFLRMFGTWWFSDKELADYVRETYGAPVYYGEFNMTRLEQDGVHREDWSWGVEGGARSELHLAEPLTETRHNTIGRRIYWFQDNGTRYMDFVEDHEIANIAPRLVYGRMEDPMLYATSGNNVVYAASGERAFNAELSAEFYRFKDLRCEEPY